MELRRYISLPDVVERYGGTYSAWTIRDRCRRGEIPHLKHPGSKCILFREDWLDLFDEGAELERETVRRRGLSPGRVVRPRKRRAA